MDNKLFAPIGQFAATVYAWSWTVLFCRR